MKDISTLWAVEELFAVRKYLRSDSVGPRVCQIPESDASRLDPYADKLLAPYAAAGGGEVFRKQKRTIKQLHADLEVGLGQRRLV